MTKLNQLTRAKRIQEAARRRQRRLLTRRGVFEALESRQLLAFDFGDAPDTSLGTGTGNYRTSLLDNGPHHGIVAGLRMGASVDAEADSSPNMRADGDDAFISPAPDDENGIANPLRSLAFTVGAVPEVGVMVTNTTGTSATLFGWIDVNQDGVFDNATERASAIVPSGATASVVNLVFPGTPFTAPVGETFARFRLSSDPAASNSTGYASDGEVEDYRATMSKVGESFVDASKTRTISAGPTGVPLVASEYYFFGRSLTSLGDIDGNGTTDFAIGAKTQSTIGNQSFAYGAVSILLMNSDGTIGTHRRLTASENGLPSMSWNANFGKAVASISDLDGDGRRELVVAAFGEIYVLFLRNDGTVDRFVKHLATSFQSSFAFGSSLASLGDIDGDGIEEIGVGDASQAINNGAVIAIYFNQDGTVRTYSKFQTGLGGIPTRSSSIFGLSIAAIGDLDGDGISEIAVGEDNLSAPGSIMILFPNVDGTVKRTSRIGSSLNGGPPLRLNGDITFGSSLAPIGDLDGDGVPDLVAGLPSSDSNSSTGTTANPGSIFVLLLKSDGTVKRYFQVGNGLNGGPALNINDFFGSSIAAIGDIDGDGIGELAVGAPGNDQGSSVPSADLGAVHILYLKSDTTAPTVSSIQRLSPSQSLTTASSLAFRLTFSEEVLNFDATDLIVVGNSQATITSIIPIDTFSYRVDVSGGLLDAFEGVVGISIAATTDMMDRAGIPLSTIAPMPSESFFVDTIAPKVLSFARLSPTASTTTENSVKFLISFSEPVQLVNANDFVVSAPFADVTGSVLAVSTSVYELTLSGGNLPFASGTLDLSLNPSRDIADIAGNLLLLIEPLVDETFNIVNFPLDFGDAPDSAVGTGLGNYRTNLADDGPRHLISRHLILGRFIDGETNGTARDDLFSSIDPDDEDGLVSTLEYIPVIVGTQTQVRLRATNSTGLPATLYGWIDFNRDGVFDNATERTSTTISTGNTNVSRTLTFPTLSGSVGQSYARFRISTDPAAANSFGLATDGEVEDYPVTIGIPSTGMIDSSKTLKISNATNGGPTLVNNDLLGSAIASLGDIDGDGINDQVVGAERDDTDGVLQSGAVYIQLMNANRTVKSNVKIARNLNGGPALNTLDYFGGSVATIGDLDGDGVPELAVGARGFDSGTLTDSGAVYILFLRSDGTAKSTTLIASGVNGGPTLQTGDLFGHAVASMGDFDGDGIVDLAVGASRDDAGVSNSNRGAVHILTLRSDGRVNNTGKIDANLLFSSGTVPVTNDEFGRALTNLGDFDGDGITDLAVGAHLDDTGGTDRGAVYIVRLNNPNQSSGFVVGVKSTTKIANATNGGPTLVNSDFFGRSVANIGDVNGDNVNDLIVGAHLDDTGGNGRGAAYVLLMNSSTGSGSSGTVVKSIKIASGLNGGPTLANFDAFGSSVALLGDLDGDGLSEIAVGATGDDSGGTDRGAVYIFSLAALTVQSSFVGSINENITSSVLVGNVTTTPDAPNTYTYSLTSGIGGTNNSSFLLSSTGALTNLGMFNFETSPTRSIRVRTTRQDGIFFVNIFTVNINNINEQPTANAGGTYTVGEGIPLTLIGSGTDPDANTTLSYEWDFNYDGVTFDVDSTVQSPSVTFPDGTATRNVALRVQDNGNPALTSLISTATVNITNLPPVLTRTNASVSGSVLSSLSNTGTWSDVVADTVTLGASLGSVVKNPDGTWAWSHTPTSALLNQVVTITASDEDGGTSQVTFTANTNVTVVNRRVFYSGSISPIFGDGSGNPINAIDPTKTALLPGETTTIANYTNYSRGLNGIVVDIASPSNLTTIGSSSFQFATWSDFTDSTANFVSVNPNVIVTPFAGGGANGSDRIKLEFPNNIIQNAWLRITMLADASTGLASNDVFYFGNARFDVTPNTAFPAQVTINVLDTNTVRARNGTDPNNISNIFDVDRSGSVNVLDTNATRAGNGTGSLRPFTAPFSSANLLVARSIDSAFVDMSWLDDLQTRTNRSRTIVRRT